MNTRDLINAEALRELVRDVVNEVLGQRATPQPTQYLSTAEAARVAGVAQGTIRRWVRQGKLKPRRAGRELRVRRSDLERLLDGHGPDDALTPEEMADRRFPLSRG